MTPIDYTRQLDILDPVRMAEVHVDLIGVGGIGTPTGLLLLKMGVSDMRIFDPDDVDEVNLPNQTVNRRSNWLRPSESENVPNRSIGISSIVNETGSFPLRQFTARIHQDAAGASWIKVSASWICAEAGWSSRV